MYGVWCIGKSLITYTDLDGHFSYVMNGTIDKQKRKKILRNIGTCLWHQHF